MENELMRWHPSLGEYFRDDLNGCWAAPQLQPVRWLFVGGSSRSSPYPPPDATRHATQPEALPQGLAHGIQIQLEGPGAKRREARELRWRSAPAMAVVRPFPWVAMVAVQSISDCMVSDWFHVIIRDN